MRSACRRRGGPKPSTRVVGRGVVLAAALVCLLSGGAPAAAAGEGTWTWPVVGPISRGFDPPDSLYGSGHRGIDIAVPPGTTAVAPASGTVKFAGPVGGQLFVSISHDGGLESTFSWVSKTLVRKGDVVFAGQAVALTGQGHPGAVVPHMHFGAKKDGSYVDPLSLLAPASVVDLIHLVPLVGEAAMA